MPDGKTATTGEDGDKNVAQLDLAEKNFRIGWYLHYKGGSYIAFATSINEATLEPMVHYYSILKKARWTRTLKNFTELVLPDGTSVKEHPRAKPRFEFGRKPLGWQELAEAAGFDELVRGLQVLKEGQDFLDTVQR